MSKCRAVSGTAFADVRKGLNGRIATGGQCRPASVSLRARTERGGYQGKLLPVLWRVRSPKFFSSFAPVCCEIDNPQNCIEHFMISFFIPKFFILVTASPFYAARRDKNGGEMLPG